MTNEQKIAVKRYGRKKIRETSILTKRNKAEKVLYGIVFAIFVIYSLSLFFPFLFLFNNSLKGSLEYIDDILEGTSLALPDKPLFSNYIEAFTGMRMLDSMGNEIYLPKMFFNSILYCLFTVGGGVAASSLTAYVLAKYRFKLRAFFYGIAIFSMTLPIIGSAGANFKLAYSLGIYNTWFYPILTGFGGFGFNFLILYGFFSNLSWSYAEAVFIDGGGHGTAFLRIMLPQAGPAILTLAIMAFISAWNDYTTVLMYLPDYPNLAAGIYGIKLSFKRNGNVPVYYAGLIVSIIPVIAIFIGFSDTIMSNFTVGGLKG